MKYFLSALCAGMLVFAGYANASPEPAAMILGDYNIITIHEHETNSALKYSYDVSYPQIKGEKLTSLEEAFNAAVRVMVTNEIVTLKKTSADPVILKAEENSNKLNRLKMDYDVALIHPQQKQLISVRFKIYWHSAIEPKPNISHEMINFNLTSGKGENITLESLFIPDSKFEKVLSRYYVPMLQTTKGVSDTDIKIVTLNLRGFSFRPDGLLITIDDLPIQVGPREVLVPYSALKNIISIYSPIAICTTKPEECNTAVKVCEAKGFELLLQSKTSCEEAQRIYQIYTSHQPLPKGWGCAASAKSCFTDDNNKGFDFRLKSRNAH